jgi:Tfp pilus assembly protein PilV
LKKVVLKLRRALSSGGESGISLAESLVAIAILGGGVLTLILTMSGGALAIQNNDQQAIAQSLARTQLEYTKSYAYDPGAITYPAVSVPSDYGISVRVSEVPGGDGNIQKITTNVTRDGVIVMTAEDYKVNR